MPGIRNGFGIIMNRSGICAAEGKQGAAAFYGDMELCFPVGGQDSVFVPDLDAEEPYDRIRQILRFFIDSCSGFFRWYCFCCSVPYRPTFLSPFLKLVI